MPRILFPIMKPSLSSEVRRVEASGVAMLLAIPWDMIAPHEAQAEENHDQSLNVLAARCGLSACEAVAVLEDRPWQMMPIEDAYRRLNELFTAAADAA